VSQPDPHPTLVVAAKQEHDLVAVEVPAPRRSVPMAAWSVHSAVIGNLPTRPRQRGHLCCRRHVDPELHFVEDVRVRVSRHVTTMLNTRSRDQVLGRTGGERLGVPLYFLVLTAVLVHGWYM